MDRRASWRGGPKGRGKLERAATLVAGLYLTGTSVSALASGRAIYSNYLGAPMLAPATIVVGALLIVIALFGWNAIAKHL